MINPDVTTVTMRTAAYFVASAARKASRSARRLPSVEAAIRLVTTRLLGRTPRGWQPGPVLGWSPCGRQGCQWMVNRFDLGTPASYLVFHMLLHTRQIPPGFVEPCLPPPPSVPRPA